MVRTCCALYILTWKCSSRHNGVHWFDRSTSKSGPGMVCFVHFDLEMCFAPQRRALFWHLNFQKWSEVGVLCEFWLGMCFAPQRRALLRHLNFPECSEREVSCTFWLGNVLRTTTACNFSSLIWPAGSAPAALARLLFDPPEPQTIEKTQWIATSLPCRAPASSFFWLSQSLIFSLLDFSLLTLPTSAFPSLHIVGSLTSKLPSMIGSSCWWLTPQISWLLKVAVMYCFSNHPWSPGNQEPYLHCESHPAIVLPSISWEWTI